MISEEQISSMIDECEQHSESLTDWELEFIDELSTAKHTPTERQVAILTRIWNKISPSNGEA